MPSSSPAHFETLLARLAAAFACAPAGGVDAAIVEALRDVSATLRLDRADLTEVAPDGQSITVTHSHAADRPAAHAGGGISVRMPWVIAQLRARRRIVFGDVDELPAEAADMRRWARADGVRSHVTTPVVIGDEVVGGFHVATLTGPRPWSEDDLRRLALLAAVLAAALARRRRESPGSERLADVERAHIREVLRRAGGRISGKGGAAERLGLHPNTLRSRMQKLGLLRARARDAGSAEAQT